MLLMGHIGIGREIRIITAYVGVEGRDRMDTNTQEIVVLNVVTLLLQEAGESVSQCRWLLRR